MEKFRGRLEDYESSEALWDKMEEAATELSDEHFEQTYDGEVCEACLRDTPVEAKWGPLSELGDEVEALAELVENQFEEIGENVGDIKAEVRGRYIDRYFDRAVAPEDCAVCNAEIVPEDAGCGHWEEYRSCPVRGDPP